MQSSRTQIAIHLYTYVAIYVDSADWTGREIKTIDETGVSSNILSCASENNLWKTIYYRVLRNIEYWTLNTEYWILNTEYCKGMDFGPKISFFLALKVWRPIGTNTADKFSASCFHGIVFIEATCSRRWIFAATLTVGFLPPIRSWKEVMP